MPKRKNTIRQLALNVQLSIARLDKLQDTMALVSELCERITGIAYPVDLNERHRTYQRKRQQGIKTVIATETRKQSELEAKVSPQPTDCKENSLPTHQKASRPKGTAQLKGSKREKMKQRNAEIRKRYFNGDETQAEIAKDLNISPGTVHRIIHKKAGQP